MEGSVAVVLCVKHALCMCLGGTGWLSAMIQLYPAQLPALVGHGQNSELSSNCVNDKVKSVINFIDKFI